MNLQKMGKSFGINPNVFLSLLPAKMRVNLLNNDKKEEEETKITEKDLKLNGEAIGFIDKAFQSIGDIKAQDRFILDIYKPAITSLCEHINKPSTSEPIAIDKKIKEQLQKTINDKLQSVPLFDNRLYLPLKTDRTLSRKVCKTGYFKSGYLSKFNFEQPISESTQIDFFIIVLLYPIFNDPTFLKKFESLYQDAEELLLKKKQREEEDTKEILRYMKDKYTKDTKDNQLIKGGDSTLEYKEHMDKEKSPYSEKLLSNGEKIETKYDNALKMVTPIAQTQLEYTTYPFLNSFMTLPTVYNTIIPLLLFTDPEDKEFSNKFVDCGTSYNIIHNGNNFFLNIITKYRKSGGKETVSEFIQSYLNKHKILGKVMDEVSVEGGFPIKNRITKKKRGGSLSPNKSDFYIDDFFETLQSQYISNFGEMVKNSSLEEKLFDIIHPAELKKMANASDSLYDLVFESFFTSNSPHNNTFKLMRNILMIFNMNTSDIRNKLESEMEKRKSSLAIFNVSELRTEITKKVNIKEKLPEFSGCKNALPMSETTDGTNKDETEAIRPKSAVETFSKSLSGLSSVTGLSKSLSKSLPGLLSKSVSGGRQISTYKIRTKYKSLSGKDKRKTYKKSKKHGYVNKKTRKIIGGMSLEERLKQLEKTLLQKYDNNTAPNNKNTAPNNKNTAPNDNNTASNDNKSASNDKNTTSNDNKSLGDPSEIFQEKIIKSQIYESYKKSGHSLEGLIETKIEELLSIPENSTEASFKYRKIPNLRPKIENKLLYFLYDAINSVTITSKTIILKMCQDIINIFLGYMTENYVDEIVYCCIKDNEFIV